MILKRWSYVTHTYKDYIVPNEWKLGLYETDMKTLINCCQCGKEIEFGETYTSQEIHTHIGFGFAVCPECHKDEMERRFGLKDEIRDEWDREKKNEGI